MKNERAENSILVLRVHPWANKPPFNIISIDDLHLVGKMDEVCLGSFVGEYGFLAHSWVKPAKVKENPFWHLFERQKPEFLERAFKFWGR